MKLLAKHSYNMLVPLFGIALLCSAPALANSPSKTRALPQVTEDGEPIGFRVKNQQLTIAPMNLDVSKFSFTAPGRVANAKTQTVERGFTFTPSRSQKSNVAVGVTARSISTAPSERTASASGLTPSGYEFDLSLGYKGFAVSGGVSKVDTGLGGERREGVDVGLGYKSKNWQAGVTATAEREFNQFIPNRTQEPNYAVEARGAVSVTPKVSVGGSLRYRPAPHYPTPLDPNKEDRAVLVGGAVAF